MLKISTESTGFSNPARDWVEERIDLNQILLPCPEYQWLMQYAGRGIRDLKSGDLIVVDTMRIPCLHDLVIVETDTRFEVQEYIDEREIRGVISFIIKKV